MTTPGNLIHFVQMSIKLRDYTYLWLIGQTCDSIYGSNYHLLRRDEMFSTKYAIEHVVLQRYVSLETLLAFLQSIL